MAEANQLSQEQQNLFAMWLNQHWKATACSACGKRNWSVTPFVWEFRQFSQGNLMVGGPIFPVLMVICEECGNLVLFSAIKVGVVKPPPKEEAKQHPPTPAPAGAAPQGEAKP